MKSKSASDMIAASSGSTPDFGRIKPKVVPVYEAHYPLIRKLLRQFEINTPHLGECQWLRLFQQHWPCNNTVRGFALEVDGDFVGFRGCIQHIRLINDAPHRIISTTSWVVAAEHRNQTTEDGNRISDMLLDAVDEWHKRENLTSIAISVRKELITRFLSRGYEVLENETVLVSTLNLLSKEGWGVIHRPTLVRPQLHAADQSLFDVHQSLPCCQFLIRRGQEQCFVIACLRRSGRLTQLVKIVYISNPPVFQLAIPSIGRDLLLRFRARWIEWDSRWLDGWAPECALRKKLTSPRMFKSSLLRPENIYNLFSEIVLLEL